MVQSKPEHRARVLLVGAPSDLQPLEKTLSRRGYEVALAEGPLALAEAARLSPDAIVVAARAEPALAMTVRNLRADVRTRAVPVLLQGPENVLRSPLFRGLQVDEELSHERVAEDLEHRLASMIRAKRLIDGEERTRGRLEALLEISQAAASSLDLTEMLRVVVKKLAAVVHSDRCAILLTEQSGELVVAATVEAPELSQRLSVDLSRYPELALALQSREAVIIEDARSDPRMAPVQKLIEPLDVRSILVQPMLSGGELQGALFLRQLGRDGAFDEEDRDFARGVASTLADHLRNARLHAGLKKKRDELEAAYVDRYRELAEANRRLKELNAFKDELLAICSHDLRAPLNVVLGHGQLLQELEGLGPQDKASVDAIVRQGKKILELVESLLERGRGEADRLELDAAEIDLAHHCHDATRELEILAKQKGITLRCEAPGELWAVVDRIKIRQVLQNLLQNAIAHAASRVTVHAERVRREGGDQARLSVVDDGPGIAPGDLAVIFDRYRHGPGEGVGLGLTICRELVELHGGEIWAENREGGGACFRMLLPLAVEVAPAREKPRVLLVEDEPAAAQLGLQILRTRYRVEVARDGAEGLAKARALRPDVILLDVFLPRLDGLDAATALQRSPDTASIPVIMIATDPQVASKVRGLDLGAADCVEKPFEPRALLAAVAGALARSSAPATLPGLDPQTGLLDAQTFHARCAQEEARARRYGRPLAVAAVALPRKATPEQASHAAQALRAAVRPGDEVGDLGQGLLGVLLLECDAALAEAQAERFARILPRARSGAVAIDPGEASAGGSERLLRELARRLRAGRR